MITYEQFEKLARDAHIVYVNSFGRMTPGCREDLEIRGYFEIFFDSVVEAIAESEKPQHQPYSEIGL